MKRSYATTNNAESILDTVFGISNDLEQAKLCAYKLQKLPIDSRTCR